MIYEKLITIETAKLANEKKFDQNGLTWLFYEKNGRRWNCNHENGNKDYICCTQDLLHQWLMDKHNMYLDIYIGHDETGIWWNVDIFKIEKGYDFEPLNQEDIGGDSHSEAFENGLQAALKLIK